MKTNDTFFTLLLVIYCATVLKKKQKHLSSILSTYFCLQKPVQTVFNTYTIMNYAENNVCCVNQYQIPVALKLPLEATMHFVGFSSIN